MVEGQEFLWHYDACCLWCSDDVFTVGRSGAPHVLFIDPFPWNFEIRPANIAAAIRWALSTGWTPDLGPTRGLAMNDSGEFEWLAEDQRHLGCRGQTPKEV